MKAIASAILLAGIPGMGLAGEWTCKQLDKEPPGEFGDDFRGILQSKALQLSHDGTVAYEFWFAREIPLKSKPESPAKVLDSVSQTTPLGVVVVPSDLRDYRDKELFADSYTIRMGFQPQDGDHLGTSDYPYFMVLIPAKTDRSPAGITEYKPMVKASGKDTPSGHPVVLSLRPVSGEPGETPAIAQPAPEHTAVRVELSGKTSSGESVPVVFDLVCEGKANH